LSFTGILDLFKCKLFSCLLFIRKNVIHIEISLVQRKQIDILIVWEEIAFVDNGSYYGNIFIPFIGFIKI
jgi:hypothetical protein